VGRSWLTSKGILEKPVEQIISVHDLALRHVLPTPKALADGRLPLSVRWTARQLLLWATFISGRRPTHMSAPG
jgi:hypothetical protein